MPYRSSLTVPILRSRIAEMRTPAFRARLAQVLAAAAGKLVNDGFRSSRDPYGKPWTPLKSRNGRPLLLTGRMRASFAAQPTAEGFRIDGTATYTKFHQYGTKPHQRAARSAKQSAKGRFVRKTASGNLLKIRAHENPGIPQRQMVPMRETGGLPKAWLEVFRRETSKLVRGQIRGTV